MNVKSSKANSVRLRIAAALQDSLRGGRPIVIAKIPTASGTAGKAGEDSLEKAQRENEALKLELKEAEKEILRVKNKRKDLKRERDFLTSELETLKQSVDQLLQAESNQEDQEKLQALTEAEETQRLRAEKLEAEVAELTAALASEKAATEKAAAEAAELKTKLAAAPTPRAEANAEEEEEIREQLGSIKVELKRKLNQISELKEINSALNARVAEAQKKSAELEKSVHETRQLSEKNMRAMAEEMQLKTEARAQVAQLAEQVAEQANQLTAIREQRDSASNEKIQSLSRSLAEAQEKVQSSTRALEARDEKIKSLEGQIESLAKESRELAGQLAAKEKTLAALKDQSDAREAEFKALETQHEEVVEALKVHAAEMQRKQGGDEDSAAKDRRSKAKGLADGEEEADEEDEGDQVEEDDIDTISDPVVLRDRYRRLQDTFDEMEQERNQMVKIIQFFNDNATDEALEKLRETLEAEQDEFQEEDAESGVIAHELEDLPLEEGPRDEENDPDNVKLLIPKLPKKATLTKDKDSFK